MDKKNIPDWLKIRIPFDTDETSHSPVKRSLKENNLNTVCESASCPNLNSCWSSGTATFLILGNICSRNCRFCDIKSGKPLPPDPAEPEKILAAVRELQLKHVVLTSVSRDDLPDGGSAHFATAIECLKSSLSGISVEALIPDFKGSADSLRNIFSAQPDIINHNLETVQSLYTTICPQSSYPRSLQLLQRCAEAGFVTKSGLLLGMGESMPEVKTTISDLRQNGVQMLTIGQYLKPGPKKANISSFIEPAQFERLRQHALSMGFVHVQSAPLVRSSYHASLAHLALKGHL